jgi:hypothetical protein
MPAFVFTMRREVVAVEVVLGGILIEGVRVRTKPSLLVDFFVNVWLTWRLVAVVRGLVSPPLRVSTAITVPVAAVVVILCITTFGTVVTVGRSTLFVEGRLAAAFLLAVTVVAAMALAMPTLMEVIVMPVAATALKIGLAPCFVLTLMAMILS